MTETPGLRATGGACAPPFNPLYDFLSRMVPGTVEGLLALWEGDQEQDQKHLTRLEAEGATGKRAKRNKRLRRTLRTTIAARNVAIRDLQLMRSGGGRVTSRGVLADNLPKVEAPRGPISFISPPRTAADQARLYRQHLASQEGVDGALLESLDRVIEAMDDSRLNAGVLFLGEDPDAPITNADELSEALAAVKRRAQAGNIAIHWNVNARPGEEAAEAEVPGHLGEEPGDDEPIVPRRSDATDPWWLDDSREDIFPDAEDPTEGDTPGAPEEPPLLGLLRDSFTRVLGGIAAAREINESMRLAAAQAAAEAAAPGPEVDQ